jgi:hypothetical protein
VDKACAACGQAIRDEEEWFRVRQDYVHRFCSEKVFALRERLGIAPHQRSAAPPPITCFSRSFRTFSRGLRAPPLSHASKRLSSTVCSTAMRRSSPLIQGQSQIASAGSFRSSIQWNAIIAIVRWARPVKHSSSISNARTGLGKIRSHELVVVEQRVGIA